MTRTLVLALGNPLRGDDGVARAVLEGLGQLDLGPEVSLVDGGTAGLHTVLSIQGWPRVIIIDAADFGAEPGTFRRLDIVAQDVESLQVLSDSLHSAGLLEAMALAAALGEFPPQVTLLGVQPRSLDYTTELSDEVRAAIPAVVSAVIHAVAE